jgi:hypothetical protein
MTKSASPRPTPKPKKDQRWRVWVFDYAFTVEVVIDTVKDGHVKAYLDERLGNGEPRGCFIGSVEELMERGELVG